MLGSYKKKWVLRWQCCRRSCRSCSIPQCSSRRCCGRCLWRIQPLWPSLAAVGTLGRLEPWLQRRLRCSIIFVRRCWCNLSLSSACHWQMHTQERFIRIVFPRELDWILLAAYIEQVYFLSLLLKQARFTNWWIHDIQMVGQVTVLQQLLPPLLPQVIRLQPLQLQRPLLVAPIATGVAICCSGVAGMVATTAGATTMAGGTFMAGATMVTLECFPQV